MRQPGLMENVSVINISQLRKNKEVSNAAWLIGGKVCQMGLSLIVGILTARFLGPGNYGLINYGMAWVTFFTALSNLGLNSVIVKEFLDHPDEEGVTIGSALGMRLLSSVLSVIMIVGIVCVLDNGEPVTITVVALCSVGLVFHMFETLSYWFQAHYMSKINAMATLTAYVIVSAYKIILLALGKDVRWFAFATSVDYLVAAAVLMMAYRKHCGAKFRFSLQKAKKLLGSSYHYILSSMMVAIYGQTDKLMLKHMLNESEVAYYSAAASICTMWVFILTAIIDSMYPTILKLHGSDREAFNRKNRQLYAIVFYFSVFVSLVLVLFGDLGVRILYGESFAPAGAPLRIITWYTAFSYLGVARNAWIVSEGKQKYLKYMYCGAAVINVILNYFLIPIAGAAGAAFASLITQLCTSILLPMCFKEMRPNALLMVDAILLRGVR